MTREGIWGRYVSDYVKFLLPILAGQVIVISFTLVDQLMASFLPVRNISALNYASLLYNLPLTLFATPIMTVLYPSISSFSADHDWQGQAKTVSRGTQLTWLIVLPCSIGLAALALPIVKLVYMARCLRHYSCKPDSRSTSVLRNRCTIRRTAELSRHRFPFGKRQCYAADQKHSRHSTQCHS